MSKRTMMRTTGLMIVIGFFLPWIDLPEVGSVSGWDLIHSDLVSDTTRMVVRGWLGLGLALIVASVLSERLASVVGVLSGGLIIGFTLYWLAHFFFDILGIGLFMVVGAGAGALVLGLLGGSKQE